MQLATSSSRIQLNGDIREFDTTGTFVGSFGTTLANVSDPRGIVFCPVTVDQDGDGIEDQIDRTLDGTTDQSAVASNDFTTQPLGGMTFRSLRDRADLQVSVQAQLPSDGVLIRAGGGGVGTAKVKMCNGHHLFVLLADGDEGQFLCGSLQIQVSTGPIEIMVSDSAMVTVPAGATVTVTEDPANPGMFSVENSAGSPEIEISLDANAGTTVQVPAGATVTVTEDPANPGVFTVENGVGSTAPITVMTPSGPVVVPPGGNAMVVVLIPIPTLPQWGMILLTLSLLTLATWQLAARPVVIETGASRALAGLPIRSQWFTSLLLGQGLATVGLVLYAVLVGPLVPHDGLGGFLAGLLLGVLVEGYHRGR